MNIERLKTEIRKCLNQPGIFTHSRNIMAHGLLVSRVYTICNLRSWKANRRTANADWNVSVTRKPPLPVHLHHSFQSCYGFSLCVDGLACAWDPPPVLPSPHRADATTHLPLLTSAPASRLTVMFRLPLAPRRWLGLRL